MPSFDPLTANDLTILAELTTAPIKISTADLMFSERGKALNFLCQCGYAQMELTHISREGSSSINTVTATGKTAPTA
jgi:hypothetical protein